MHVETKIALVYHIAAKMHREMNYTLAQKIAKHFSEIELNRIFSAIK